MYNFNMTARCSRLFSEIRVCFSVGKWVIQHRRNMTIMQLGRDFDQIVIYTANRGQKYNPLLQRLQYDGEREAFVLHIFYKNFSVQTLDYGFCNR